MFIDEATIHVRGGNGGPGCLSFRREKYAPKGGPDGGDGGRGGSVILLAKEGVETLLDFAGSYQRVAPSGRPGSGKNMTGRSGDDLVVPVPPGTLVYDKEHGLLLKDLTPAGAEVCIARGGRGGFGNRHFATSTNQAPRRADPGEPGEERWLRLELKLIADVGLVGLPNAGKSTLLSRLSKARPKIADYPFTTLKPQLGIVELSRFRRFVMADLPGLIEGAHRGAGLGHAFLRHIERTRVILHVIDAVPLDSGPTPLEAHRVIRAELGQYSATLAAKPELIVLNKMDLTGSEAAAAELAAALGQPVLRISAATGRGLAPLAERLWQAVQQAKGADTSGALDGAQTQIRGSAGDDMTMAERPDAGERAFVVVDIGNTRIAVGRWERAAVMDTVRLDAADRDGFVAALKGIRTDSADARSLLTGIASVVPETLAWIKPAVLSATGREAMVVGEHIPLPLPLEVRQPERVGVDRVCSAAAAYRRVGAACTVVQFGTAITVDVVSDDGVFLGGAILPGLAMQARALHEFTAALPHVGLAGNAPIIGRDTEEAIRSGILRGAAGAVRGLVEAIATQLGKWPQVVATGGDAARMAEHCDFVDSLVADLALLGVGDCLNDRFGSGDPD